MSATALSRFHSMDFPKMWPKTAAGRGTVISRSENMPPILQLPRELRDEIYEYVVAWHPELPIICDDMIVYGNASPQRPNFLPAICTVSKQIYQEAVLVYIRRTRFVIANTKAAEFMIKWLSQVDHGFENVQRLELFSFNPVSPVNAHVNLLTRCTHVRLLVLRKGYGSHDSNNISKTPSITLSENNPHLHPFRNFTRLRQLDWSQDPNDGSLAEVKVLALYKLVMGCNVTVTVYSRRRWSISREITDEAAGKLLEYKKSNRYLAFTQQLWEAARI